MMRIPMRKSNALINFRQFFNWNFTLKYRLVWEEKGRMNDIENSAMETIDIGTKTM